MNMIYSLVNKNKNKYKKIYWAQKTAVNGPVGLVQKGPFINNKGYLGNWTRLGFYLFSPSFGGIKSSRRSQLGFLDQCLIEIGRASLRSPTKMVRFSSSRLLFFCFAFCILYMQARSVFILMFFLSVCFGEFWY